MGEFQAKQNVAKDVTTTEAEIRSAVLDQRLKLKEGAIAKKPAKKSRMRVQVSSPSKKEEPQAKVADETARTESGSKPEEEAEKEEPGDGEGLGGGLLGLGDYGSDDE